MNRLKINLERYIEKPFTPYINLIRGDGTKELDFIDQIILTSNQAKLLREHFGRADFQYDGFERSYAWGFEWNGFEIIYFCSKKGGSIEVFHEQNYQQNMTYYEAKKLSETVFKLRESVLIMLKKLLRDFTPSKSTVLMKIENKKFYSLNSVKVDDHYEFIAKEGEECYTDLKSAQKAGYQAAKA